MYPWLLFFLIGGVFTMVVGSAVVVVGLRRAPIAKEDENGFHVIEKSAHATASASPVDVAQITS